MQSFLFRPANFLHKNQRPKKAPEVILRQAMKRAKKHSEKLVASDITRHKPLEERIIEAQTARATRRAEKRKEVSNFSSDVCF
jgi:hypothetical protein